MVAASEAASTPPPMAMPTSATASALASFTPSPTMATRRPAACSCCTSAALLPGFTSAYTLAAGMPTARATAAALSLRSPGEVHAGCCYTECQRGQKLKMHVSGGSSSTCEHDSVVALLLKR